MRMPRTALKYRLRLVIAVQRCSLCHRRVWSASAAAAHSPASHMLTSGP